MFINASYTYYGSINTTLKFVEGDIAGTIKLCTDYGEVIATVSDICELREVIKKIENDELEFKF